MQRKHLSEVERYAKQNRRRSIWRKIVGAMACVVVFCTTYALILPAITQEKETLCGMEEHIHTDSCYVQVTSRQVERLACSYETMGVHVHTETCYDAENVLRCGTVDFVVHEHDDTCTDETGTLACQLPEIKAHEHSDECYQATEEDHEPELVCGEEQILLHTHTEDCFDTSMGEDGTEQKTLVCTRPEVIAHSHTEDCFTTGEEPVDTESLTCGLTETHTALCYGTWELSCELPEHTHTEECWPDNELTEEEQAQVDAVIAQIDALESADQVEAKLAAYEDAEDWEGYAACKEEAAQKTQAVRDNYNVLSDAQKQKVTNVSKLNELDWLVPTTTLTESDDSNKGQILPSLDGDWAYITDFKLKEDSTTASGYSVRTGTSPWDDDNEAGNDTDDLNDILRSFDVATYTIQFNTTLREAAAKGGAVGGIEKGRIYFEFVLPYSAKKAQFETDTMGWLLSSQNIKYEVVTATVNGVESQVLRGSFDLVATGSSNPAAIGASTNELSVVVRALQMTNGETIRPIFTLWLQHNEVGATYDPNDDRLPTTIVTGLGHICGAEEETHDGSTEKHDVCEAVTIEGTEINISARPMFNIGMNGINSNNTAVGTFDFGESVIGISTVTQPTINVDLGEIYGRMNGYGLRIELRGKSGQGMRGAELPDENTPIEFDITITSLYGSSDKTAVAVPSYQAQFWSGDANASRGTGGYNNDGRYIYTTKDYIHSSLPYNFTKSGEEYKRCFKGGDWTFTINPDGTIHVKISGFKFNTESLKGVAKATAPFNFPYSYTSGTKDIHHFYDPDTVKNYWEIGQAVFSTGELWVVQPYYGLPDTEYASQYIAEVKGEGQFFTKAQVTSLYIKTVSGEVVDDVHEQIDTYPSDDTRDGTVDDVINNGQYLKTPGGIDGRVIYTKGETRSVTTPLTEGAQQDDFDWAAVGTEVTLASWIFHSKAEGEFVGVAYDNLIKFDDEFFLPDTDSDNFKISGKKTGQTATVLWAAKKDGTGWNDDEEMKMATPDDLVFYPSITDLKNAGVTCIGVMVEVRGVGEESGENQLILYVDGVIRDDCTPEQVYMVTRTSYAWCKKDVAAAALAYHNEKYPDNKYDSAEKLTKADYNEYVQDSVDGFPSRGENISRLLSSDHLTVDADGKYPKPFWRQDYYSTSARPTGGSSTNNVNQDGTVNVDAQSKLKTATKATYENGVYKEGVGAYYYQDSCLVIPYEVTITKVTAQSEKESTASKSVYDMGQNQRTVDYVLNASIVRITSEQGGTYTGPAMGTTVYIEDTLPASLSYIPGSAYFGGTYTQDPSHQNQGTCTGMLFESTADANTQIPSEAHPYLETITLNDDGTTTIRWIFNVQLGQNVASWTNTIYFSCFIGTPGVEATDVKNGQSIDNTVKIWTSDNNSRPFELGYGNKAIYGIKIMKTTALSLSEISDQLVMDWWDSFGFTKNVGNNSSNPKNDTIIVNTLPFNGLYRSDFTGQLVVTEFSAAVVDESSSSLGNFKFYYTTSDAYAGWLSSDYKAQLTGDMTVYDWLEQQNAEATVWNELTFDSVTTEVAGMDLFRASNLPSLTTQEEWGTYSDGQKQQITAIIAVGDLSAGATMKMHVTVELPHGAASDYMVSYLSQDSLSSYARAQAVNRSIEGLTWLDADEDGIQDADEELISDVWAILYKLDETTEKYEQYHFGGDPAAAVVYVKTGQMISVQAGSRSEAVVYDKGRYKFTDLPAGTYQVLFKSSTGDGAGFDLATYVASPQDIGEDDKVDSDASATYDSSSPKKMQTATISGIVMKEAKELVYGIDESKYHDFGFHLRTYELPNTGGSGTTTYTVVGLVLILSSTANLLYRAKKRRREVN